ncbi:MAG TPA: arginine--tRNA ligase [Gaiellaceae bacterium]|nr:arginine--tRNA ligase [Gaiellaceae bacterium]
MTAKPSAVDRLAARVSEALGTEVALERPKDPTHGDFATNVAMRNAKPLGRPPRELAEEYAAKAVELDEVESAEVAGPGFLNLRVVDAFFLEALGEIHEGYGGAWIEQPEHVQVEMVSANPTGPILVSHARNGAYGDSVARLLAFGGDRVEREYYYNDSGGQMERFRRSVEASRAGEAIPEDGYHGAYIHDLAKVEGDPVPAMLTAMEATLERFRVHFDSWALQSVVERRLDELLPRLDTYERDGATWARSSAYGDDEDRVLIRSAEHGATPTYRAADVPYLVDKLERGFDRAIYVLGADHHGTSKWYEAVARMLGLDPSRVEVLLYQPVHLTSGGEQTKMSKRRGDVVFLDDFMDEVGVDAARWYLVNRGPDQAIEIDLDLAAEKSQKNPVYYVQYAHARIAAILRNAEDGQVGGDPPGPLAPEEKELIKRLTDFPVTVREAAERRGPQLLPAYAIRLADDYHRFYHECRVLGDPAQAFRLGLCRSTQQVIARCLDLVGVDAPHRM